MTTDLTHLRRADTGLGAAIRWRVNHSLMGRVLWLVNLFRGRFTVFDAFGAPGDTLLTAIVCRHVKQRYPRIRLNILTPNPELIRHDPHIDEINQPESYCCLWQWYLDHVEHKEGKSNVLSSTFRQIGIARYDYRSGVYLTQDERETGKRLLGETRLPVLAFNTLSKEPVKNWTLESWLALLDKLAGRFELVHLGDDREPVVPGVRRFAGFLGMRESMAVLAHARLYIGPDSFLMHAANGLNVPSVIIFGGSRTPENLGYPENVNLFVEMPCGPCWIHDYKGERCAHDFECLRRISVSDVFAALTQLARKHSVPIRE
jgi:ADP-heptose:LPS heptosyltransferase